MRTSLGLVLALAACGRIGFGQTTSGDAADGSDSVVADPDLIVHVTFDGTTMPSDGAGLLGAVSCVSSRCPGSVPGRIGNAAAFDGVDDYLLFSSVAALDFGAAGQPFSISMWYRAADLTPPTQRVLLAQSTDNGSVSYQLSFEPWQAGTALDLVWKVCATDCQSGMFAVASDLAALDRWTLVVGTWDGNITRLFVDAQLIATMPKAQIAYDGFPFMIGADYETGGSIQDTFDGLIDDLRVYRRELTVAEQQQLLAAP